MAQQVTNAHPGNKISAAKSATNLSKGIDADMDSALLETFLKMAIDYRATSKQHHDVGIYLRVETEEEPRFMKGGVVKNVRVDSAWVMFTIDNITFRTTDRDTFCEWYQSPNPAPFSSKKGEEHRFGPPNVTFTINRGFAS